MVRHAEVIWLSTEHAAACRDISKVAERRGPCFPRAIYDIRFMQLKYAGNLSRCLKACAACLSASFCVCRM